METALNVALPFYSSQPDLAGTSIYHSHALCRVAQSISAEFRIAGTGEGRQQCPFCFLLSEFQMNRELRQQQLARIGRNAGKSHPPDKDDTSPNVQSLRQLQAHAGRATWRKHA